MMKRYNKIFVIACLFMFASWAQAQQVNTLYFLENAPMRHTINPAFQPVSKVYITLPAIGYTSFWAGNNAFNMGRLVFNDPITNQTITALHPNAQGNLWKQLPKTTLVSADAYVNLLGFGFRIKDSGYFHFNLAERIDAHVGIPNQLFGLVFGESLTNVDLSALNVSASVYTELALGYSHFINDQWTVGGKVKLLSGQAYADGRLDNLMLHSSPKEAYLRGEGELAFAGLINGATLPDFSGMAVADYLQLIKPTELGAAFDLGFTYKPIENLQITASVTDLGFIHWKNASSGRMYIDTTFNGIGDFTYSDYVQDGVFQLDSLLSYAGNTLVGYADALHVEPLVSDKFTRMITANLNVGIDANFWKNRVGVGVYSRTRFYNQHITEEVTLGAAFRPCNWFNLAASYSFINGHGGNLGAAMSFAFYDGIMFTVAADYIPMIYAKADANDMVIPIPYKTSGVNLSFGMAIVAGTNHRDKKVKLRDSDRDGVKDPFDLCPNTPRRVKVDMVGCPLDSDGDGIPDYMDKCEATPAAAYGMVDSVGCPVDTDMDGVPDYLDLCPETTEEERPFVNSYGCPSDSDGDGVTDNIDECPDTPEEARGYVDSVGCLLDRDGDFVPDYLDQCPDTPGSWKNMGCPEIKQELTKAVEEAMEGVYFDTGKSTIKKQSYKALDELAKVLKQNPNHRLHIHGHTDNVGSYKLNKDLSLRRAYAVRNYLRKKGVADSSMIVEGFAYNKPVASNSTASGRAKNRRVELTITYQE